MKEANFDVYNIESQRRDIVTAFGIEGVLLTSGIYIDLIFTPSLGFKNVYFRGILV